MKPDFNDFIERTDASDKDGRTIYLRHQDMQVKLRTNTGQLVTAFPSFWNKGTMKLVVEISLPGSDYSIGGTHYVLDLKELAKWAIRNEGMQPAPPTMNDLR